MERMKNAVQNLGRPMEAILGANPYSKTTQNDILRELLVSLARREMQQKEVVAVSGVEPPTPRI